MSLPTASAIESKTESKIDSKIESKTDMDALLVTLKGLEAGDLFKIMKQALTEAEKRNKTPKEKKGSMPKGVVPTQLKKPRAWIEFTLKHAQEHGWEPFTIVKKSKESTEMPGSFEHNGGHVYKESVTEKTPEGKQLIYTYAMSLSKQRWSPKSNSGTHEDLYKEFEQNYVEDVVIHVEPKVKMTLEQKQEQAALKKADKEREKEEKKAEKVREKEAKKAEKEAEKQREKDAKKASPVKKAKTEKKVEKKVESVIGVVNKPLLKKKKVEKVEWSCPADGQLHPWPFKGTNYLRNSDNDVYLRGEDGGMGDWQGVYLPAEDRIDDSQPEPEYEDEE